MASTEHGNSSKRVRIVDAPCCGANRNASKASGTTFNKRANTTTMPARQKQKLTSNSKSSLLTGKLSRL